MPQAVTVTPEEREAIERVSLSALVLYLLFYIYIYIYIIDFNYQLHWN
jgi:hypothetical protein